VCGKAFKSFSNLRNHRKTHARQQRQEEVAAAQVAMETSAAVALVEASQVELANGQPQLIHIQTSTLQQVRGRSWRGLCAASEGVLVCKIEKICCSNVFL
jgi:hypothetical protein